ncbi:MAG: TatD family hydrolase [Bacteroidetes bacterium]|nr:TatD family hydrolase [Bacteroidota bacterium]
MKFIDTHAHIYLEQFKKDIADVVERSIENGVEKIYLPNIDHTSIDDMLELEHKFPGVCFPMMGLHPCSVDNDFEKQLYIAEDWIGKRDFNGIGEIGTDLYWDKTFWEQQQEALKIQLGWAREKKWPAILHCRESIDETIGIVKEMKHTDLRGIFHCFTGTVEQAEEIINLGFYLGIGGVSTFKNGGLEEVLEKVDLAHMVLETDSPYLAPVPFRGKRNEPSRIPLIADRIAILKNIEVEQVGEITSQNAIKIFESDAI